MRSIGVGCLTVLLTGLLALAGSSAWAASFEMLVPGEMLTDEEIDPYYGKGTEGVEVNVIDGTATVEFQGNQNNIDDFTAEITSSSGGDQGFPIVTQVSGDYARVNNLIMIDVNVNGVEIGGPIAVGNLDGMPGFTTNLSGNTIDLTGTAQVDVSAGVETTP